MGETNSHFQKWWDDMNAKYNWENHPKGNWKINFTTNEFFLIINE
jgi:CXXX repeat modification system protein